MRSIKQHLHSGQLTTELLFEPLNRLKLYLLQNKIVTRDLNSSNIVCFINGSDNLKLYLVDGVGNADFIKIANYSSFYSRRKINRSWARFMDKMSKTESQLKRLKSE